MGEHVGGTVGFSGTQQGMTDQQKRMVRELLIELEPDGVEHGDCIGADADFHAIVMDLNKELDDLIRISIRPGTDHRGRSPKRAYCAGADEIHDPEEYWIRNTKIARNDVLIATPKGVEVRRSGTWTTIRAARRRGTPRYIVWPDGEVSDD